MANQIHLRADGSIDQTIVDLGADWYGTALAGTAMAFVESMVQVDTLGGTAGTSVLSTITNGGTGKLLMLCSTDADRVVVLEHNTGNIWSPSGDDVALDDPNKVVWLVYTGDVWSIV